MKSLALGTEEDVDDSDASYFVCGAHASEEQAELGTHKSADLRLMDCQLWVLRHSGQTHPVSKSIKKVFAGVPMDNAPAQTVTEKHEQSSCRCL